MAVLEERQYKRSGGHVNSINLTMGGANVVSLYHNIE